VSVLSHEFLLLYTVVSNALKDMQLKLQLRLSEQSRGYLFIPIEFQYGAKLL